jgi:zinc transport system substrate-binding protein
MWMNRKQQAFLLALSLMVVIFVGVTYWFMEPSQDTGKVRVVASFYPLVYFSEEIGGSHVDVRSLTPYNAEVHSWQPSVEDIIALSEADIIAYNGAGLDHWFEEDMLPVLDTRGKVLVETSENLTLITSSGDPYHEGESEDGGHYDPHTWLSPYLAKQQAQAIFNSLVMADPANADYYSERWHALAQRFEELDVAYFHGLANRSRDTIFVTHAAFGYLAERYGFAQEGVIGISADEQPSIESIASLVESMIEHDTYAVFVDAVYSDEYALALKTELESRTGQEVLILELSLVLGPVDGKDYFGQMGTNLNSLKIGLGVT